MSHVLVGAEFLVKTIEAMQNDAESVASKCVYEGAGVVADGIREAIKKLPLQTFDGRRRRGITDVERKGLLDGLGISQHRHYNGVVETKIGFEGYNDYETDKYPQGHPNSMVARSIEAGTSWLTKTPFIAPTARRLKPEVVESMQKELDRYIRTKEK